jgi:hypothetical protein
MDGRRWEDGAMLATTLETGAERESNEARLNWTPLLVHRLGIHYWERTAVIQ